MVTTDLLTTSVSKMKGIGPKLATLFAKKGVDTFEDALFFLPRAYEDRRKVTLVRDLQVGQNAVVFGEVVKCREIGAGRHRRFEASIEDPTGRLTLQWFHAFPGLVDDFSVGNHALVYGTLKVFFDGLQISHPEYEILRDWMGGKLPLSQHFGRIVPIYSETEGLAQKRLRRLMSEMVRLSLPALEEPFPKTFLDRMRFPDIKNSFCDAHFPKDTPAAAEVSPAIQRIIFEELFVWQLALELRRKQVRRLRSPSLQDASGACEKFLTALPFALTGDQKAAIHQIQADMAQKHPMVRLIQGDVGCGKTLVALASAVIAAKSEYQTAILAPTEVLAQQIFSLAERWLGPLGISTQLLTSATHQRGKGRILDRPGLVVVGTHAVFQRDVKFERLGFVVIDEQHRFGVDQRNELLRKAGDSVPHLLMMTATPIPRTLALTLYGDLELTQIREKPVGRPPIQTRILLEKERPRLYQKIRETIQRGEQAFIIYPLVEMSDKLDLKSATEMHQRLSREVFPSFRLGLLHGRLDSEEKDQILSDFRAGKFQILVSTTVIEVGIDVANATLMVIEHPERLGLSQLHQLRGRVGRGEKASECLLIASFANAERLQILARSADGFVIAEEDLKLRGPGEFLGTRQSGMPGFRVADVMRDAPLLDRARAEAQRLISTDPNLSAPENARIRVMVETRWRDKIDRLHGG